MKIIAHRGASAERPENTLSSIERALEIGVDAVEVDLLLSKEGRLVVRHDDLILHRGRWHNVRELAWQELRQCDVGQGERIPLLEELFERVAGRSPLFLDLKTFGMAEPLARALQTYQAPEAIHVTSVLLTEISDFSRLCPEVERSIVLAAVPIRFDQLFEDSNTRQVSLFRGYLSQEIAARLREEGIRMRVYPVNLPQEAQRFRAWGVEAIFTDDPAGMQGLRE